MRAARLLLERCAHPPHSILLLSSWCAVQRSFFCFAAIFCVPLTPPTCFRKPDGPTCHGKPINAATLARLFGPGNVGPAVLNPSSTFHSMSRQCNAVTGCAAWQYDAWNMIMNPGMSFANVTVSIGISDSNAVSIWTKVATCSSPNSKYPLSMTDGSFKLAYIYMTGCNLAVFKDGSFVSNLIGFVSTTCFSIYQNYTITGGPGGSTYQAKVWLNSNIVFPN